MADSPSDLKNLSADITADLALYRGALEAKKTGGTQAVLHYLATNGQTLLSKEVKDVAATVPVVKSGFKTSEFWLAIGSLPAVNALWLSLTKSPAPLNVNALIAGIAGVYTLARTWAKKAPAVLSPIVTSTVTTSGIPSIPFAPAFQVLTPAGGLATAAQIVSASPPPSTTAAPPPSTTGTIAPVTTSNPAPPTT